jgi:hypothetical protein
MATNHSDVDAEIPSVNSIRMASSSTQAFSEARCCCGGFKVVCSGEPVRVSMCHCNSCQQRTGSAFGTQCRFSVDQVTRVGTSTKYTRVADSGGKVTYDFCPECGSSVCWEIAGLDGVVVVALGAFAGTASFPAPVFSVYEDRAHSWALKAVPEGAEHWA